MNLSQKNISKQTFFSLKQIIGSDDHINNIEDEDIITCLAFDSSSDFLAIGDNAGRVIIFKQSVNDNKNYQYFSEFQSHNLQFDSLKSLRMNQSIKNILWLKTQGKYQKMLTANGHRIKLWKMYQKQQKKLILTKQTQNPFDLQTQTELAIPLLEKQSVFTSNPQLIFPIKHQTFINNVEVTKNQQFVFSTDQSKALLWSFQRPDSPFVLEDVINKNSWQQGEIISCSKMHTNSDNIFLCGSNKGTIQLNDMRQALHCRNNVSFLYKKDKENCHNFAEMTRKVNSLSFLQEKYIVSRDYLTIKIWDMKKPTQPLKIIHTNQKLKDRLSDLFEQQCLQDEFDISTYDDSIVTGSYDNRFNAIDPFSGGNFEYKMSFAKEKCWRVPLHRETNQFKLDFDVDRKIQKTCAHRDSRKIALASLNSLFIYQQNQ